MSQQIRFAPPQSGTKASQIMDVMYFSGIFRNFLRVGGTECRISDTPYQSRTIAVLEPERKARLRDHIAVACVACHASCQSEAFGRAPDQ